MTAPVFENAPCAAKPEAFYPATFGKRSERKVRAARAVCLTQCPYTAQCLQLALDTDDDEGIFGGTTPHQRRLMKTRQVVA